MASSLPSTLITKSLWPQDQLQSKRTAMEEVSEKETAILSAGSTLSLCSKSNRNSCSWGCKLTNHTCPRGDQSLAQYRDSLLEPGCWDAHQSASLNCPFLACQLSPICQETHKYPPLPSTSDWLSGLLTVAWHLCPDTTCLSHCSIAMRRHHDQSNC